MLTPPIATALRADLPQLLILAQLQASRRYKLHSDSVTDQRYQLSPSQSLLVIFMHNVRHELLRKPTCILVNSACAGPPDDQASD